MKIHDEIYEKNKIRFGKKIAGLGLFEIGMYVYTSVIKLPWQ
jgi:hypothetical protein